MAHGSAILHVCNKCGSFIYVERFSKPEKCPTCHQIPIPTTKEKLRNDYNISILKSIPYTFNWFKIKNLKMF